MINIPDRGSLIWVNFDPRAGREQSGIRPAIVLSRAAYNQFWLCIVCPITSQVKWYAFEVIIEKESPIHWAILSNHVTSIDWRSRALEWYESVCIDEETLKIVTDYVSGLVNGK